jgi:hypothetical protein
VLYLVSCGKNRIKDIAHLLKKPQGQINAKINQLLEFDVITRNGDFLKITDRVFGFWLKFVYQEKLLSLNFDDKNQKKKFREYIEKMTQDFFLDAQKSVVQRLLELLPLFGDETLQIDTKRLRLNHFREIKRLEFNSPQVKDGLMGRSGEGLWIMGFKPGSLKEEDIAEFSRECKKYRHKLQRNIIVTLQDIDTNTRLRALEEKILTWDIQHLNQLLEIFSKPWVVI